MERKYIDMLPKISFRMFGQLISFVFFGSKFQMRLEKNVKNERNERRPLNIKMIRETLKIKIVNYFGLARTEHTSMFC